MMLHLSMFVLAFLFIGSCGLQRSAMFPEKHPVIAGGTATHKWEDKAILEKKIAPPFQGSAGVILYYVNDKGEKFVLLGRERAGKHSGGTWCELGGRVEMGESLVEAAMREAKEESGGVYNLQASDIFHHGIVHYHEAQKIDDNSKRAVLYIFLRTHDYHTAGALEKKVNQQVIDEYKEKDGFKWVSLSSLLAVKQNPCLVQDIEGNSSALRLRNFFYEVLQRASFRAKLASIG